MSKPNNVKTLVVPNDAILHALDTNITAELDRLTELTQADAIEFHQGLETCSCLLKDHPSQYPCPHLIFHNADNQVDFHQFADKSIINSVAVLATNERN